MPPNNILRVAAVHSSPKKLFSASSATSEAIARIKQAADNKANLIVFPESYIPAFPVWSSIIPPARAHHLFAAMASESVYADGHEVGAIAAAARERNVYISLGISEKARYSTATLWNSNLIIGPEGQTLVHHRKLSATWFEKLTWAAGDGHGLRVVQTPWAKVGALICGENTNPLARYAMMAQGEQVHIATWPSVWPSRMAGSATKSYDNVAANRTRLGAHCFEAKAFGISCAGYLSPAAKQEIVELCGGAQDVADTLEGASNSATMFLDPNGQPLRSFVVDQDGREVDKEALRDEEDVLYADMDISQTVEGKQYHDVVGGYQRMDVFDFKVDRTRREPAVFKERVFRDEGVDPSEA